MNSDRKVSIAVDTQGGDNGIDPIVQGALEALKVHKDGDLHVVLVGDQAKIESVLKNFNVPSDISILPAPDEITMHDFYSVRLVKEKERASMFQAIKTLSHHSKTAPPSSKEILAQEPPRSAAVISTGNTGVYGSYAHHIVGTLHPLIKKPSLVQEIPTVEGETNVITDVGFYNIEDINHQQKIRRCVELCFLGAIYARGVLHISHPRIALLNIGEEKSKGPLYLREVNELLKRETKQCHDLFHFIGNVEPDKLNLFTKEKADVFIVADAFMGNLLLKNTEGILTLTRFLTRRACSKNLKTSFGGALLKNDLRQEFSPYSNEAHGAAPLLGLNELCFVCHGKSDAQDITRAISKAHEYVVHHIMFEIRNAMKKLLPLFDLLRDPQAFSFPKGELIPFQKKDKTP